MNTKKRASVRVTGRVQGIGFRFFCQRRAAELGLSGWVRNLSGGDVELEAQGFSQALQEFLKEIETGPLGAHVKSVQVNEIPTEEGTQRVDEEVPGARQSGRPTDEADDGEFEIRF